MLFRPPYYRSDDVRRPGDQPREVPNGRRSDRHTLGSIIWLAMLRLTLTIFVAWYLLPEFADYREWWVVTLMAVYGIAIYPAQIQYSHFKRTSRKLMEQTLCSSCRHFNPEGLHCTQLDEHVSEYYLPCDGEGWEPKSFEDV